MIKRKITSSIGAMAVSLCLVLLLIFEKTATHEAVSALTLSVKRVIPSLFPFMVLSDIIISMDLLMPIYSLIPTEKLFRLPRCTASVILCGLLCGFPIGAAGAAKLYAEGKINRREAEVLCAVSSHASPAFLIGVVGSIWGSKRFGVMLYFAQVLFCLISGVVISHIALPKASSSKSCPENSAAKPRFSPSLCSAVHSASLTCMTVTGNILFFRVLGSVLSVVIPTLAPVFSVMFEFSGGTVYGATIGGQTGGFLTGLAVGFSGVAVLMQCCNFTSPYGIKLNCYIFTKAVEGLVLGAFAALWVWKYGLIPSESTVILLSPREPEISLLLLFALTVLFLLTSRPPKRKNFTHGS
ncbi:MAG: hypothetical protein E7628_00005 [Ruminococcaceae bacterium]|nr:hypothetical protein [Oscillospiraceae bacterium]